MLREVVYVFKLKLSACVKGYIEEKQRYYEQGAINDTFFTTTNATTQAKGIKEKLLRNICRCSTKSKRSLSM